MRDASGSRKTYRSFTGWLRVPSVVVSWNKTAKPLSNLATPITYLARSSPSSSNLVCASAIARRSRSEPGSTGVICGTSPWAAPDNVMATTNNATKSVFTRHFPRFAQLPHDFRFVPNSANPADFRSDRFISDSGPLFAETGEAGSLPPTFIILYRKARLRADIKLLATVVTWDTGISVRSRYEAGAHSRSLHRFRLTTAYPRGSPVLRLRVAIALARRGSGAHIGS